MIQTTLHPAPRRSTGFRRRFFPLAVLGLAAVVGVPSALAQDEAPLNRREVSRAIDIAEDHLDDAERALRDEDAEAAQAAFSQAGGLFLRVLQDHPYRRDIRMRLGRIYLHFEEWENVASAFEEALMTDPPTEEEDIDGWAFENVEDAEEILEAWTAVTSAYGMLEDDLKVIEAGQKVIELNPNPPASTFVAIGSSMARQGQFEEASSMARRALEIEPDSAMAHSTLGQAAAAGGDLDEAEASFRRAVELDPNTARAHAGLADIYYEREDFQAAVDAATAALGLNDQLTAAYGIRGLANNALGNSAEAQGDLSMAVTVNPDDPAANLAFAQVYEALENRGQASSYYRKVTTLANSPPASKVTAHVALGRFAIENLNYDEAVNHMNEAVAADPNSEEAKAGLGMASHASAKAKRQAQDVAGALAAAQAASAADPDNPVYQVEHGIALILNQQVADAVPVLEAGVPNFPADGNMDDLAVGHWALGQAYMAAQNFAGAETQFSEATQKMDSWGAPFQMLAWAHTAQIAYGPCRLKDAAFGERMQAAGVGCPATDADYERVAAAATQYEKAVALGVQDPVLAERIAVLQEVRNQVAE
ncbi:MAG: tetratricopeptide repeat protein [Acidobacteriota bacterium]|nr:tetratricopeptide repeat protein [Acidobacteriota bacterium]MDE2710265.1 tetratricopeptide repeat protein [Acidobacteriota bacterium]MXW72223.1 tetratricopeptide repeat protein [Acidobacteriota bacterium]MYE43314.1 tetratricopeptide repeat protein [Acidobacteriota bacterium]MYF77735.1 tetratricopeptide repeat protein [Acidobacteriota bacterium]